MALPLYVLAGRLMQYGGIAAAAGRASPRRWSVGCAGGLAAAVVLTSMLFATISAPRPRRRRRSGRC
jgi:C4-dicarboxylate transporter, DctM subunit